MPETPGTDPSGRNFWHSAPTSGERRLAPHPGSPREIVQNGRNDSNYQANPKSPIFAELCAIAQKTVGLAEPLRKALAPLEKRIEAAFVFGSVAKRSDNAASDIDVLVLSDDLDYADVFAALQSAEAKLGRTVNPTVYTGANWRKKRKAGNPFVVKVAAQPKVFFIGAEQALV